MSTSEPSAERPMVATSARDREVLPPEELLTIDQVSKRTTYSRGWIYDRIKAGKFPKPVSLGPKRVAWRASMIQKWIDELPEGDPAAKRA